MTCKNKNCPKTPPKGRRECGCCRNRKYVSKNPIKRIWNDLKFNAKRRSKHFDIPLDWFTSFVHKSGYDKHRGRASDSLTIDRIDNDKGYIPENIQVISKSENCKKWHEDYRRITKGTILEENEADAPF